MPPEVSSVSAADETRSDGATGRRIVVASSVMADERAPRSSAPLPAALITERYLISRLIGFMTRLSFVWFLVKL